LRPYKKAILIERPPSTPPNQEELEVVGLKGFLALPAPEVDLSLVDQRFEEAGHKLTSRWDLGSLPSHIRPISELSQAEAAEILLGFLGDAQKAN
jgi:hypothetical protein